MAFYIFVFDHLVIIELNVLYFTFLFVLQAAPVNIVIGSHVWIEDPTLAWIDGEVFRVNGQEVNIHTTNGKTVCGFVFCYPSKC